MCAPPPFQTPPVHVAEAARSMEGSLQMRDEEGDAAAAHVKTEAADENAPAPVAGSQDPAALCGGAACGGGGGAGDGQAAEELQAAASSAPVLLCE